MEIRKVPISLLNAAPYNPRKDLQPGDPEYQKIARSIEKYGCVEPIIWNEKTGNVIGGHQRLKVLAATGAVEVDVSVVQLSLEDEKALNLALNKISGQWDNEKLSAVLQDLSAGFDVEVTGFDQHEVDALVASFAESGHEYELPGSEPYINISLFRGSGKAQGRGTRCRPCTGSPGTGCRDAPKRCTRTQ